MHIWAIYDLRTSNDSEGYLAAEWSSTSAALKYDQVRQKHHSSYTNSDIIKVLYEEYQ